MKKTPHMQRLEELLRGGKLVSGGFLSNDQRNLDEIISSDTNIVEKAGLTNEKVARKMAEITETAKPRLGQWVKINENTQASVEHFRGNVVCPWPHSGVYPKRITYVKSTREDKNIFWTDLNIHMIEAHGFYEGKGAFFRIEPQDVLELLFDINIKKAR